MNKILFFIFLNLRIKTEADWGYQEDDDVIVLTPFNHDSLIREYEEVLVYYYLPECRHCVDMDKFYSNLALEFKETDTRIPFAKFNCVRHMKFCEDKLIPIFPYVKFFIREHPIVYSGKR